MKKLFAFLLAICMLLTLMLVSCAAKGNMSDMGGGLSDGYVGAPSINGSTSSGKGDYDGSIGESAPMEPDVDGGVVEDPSDTPGDEPEEKPGEDIRLPAGMITAGAWNDNTYYQSWHALFEQGDSSNGKFFSYTMPMYSWGFNSLDRVKVYVSNGDKAVAGATVVATDEQGNTLYSAVTDAEGNAYLFPNAESGIITITNGTDSITATFSAEERSVSVELNTEDKKLNVIEIMLVVDVTGSMGDEINFLKAELADVIDRIAFNDSNTIIKLAMLFYRDTEDKVPFEYYDFTDVTTAEGLAKQQSALNGQKASGGGDYPEAVDQALDMAVSKQWSTGATTKIIFHVLDAPAHSGDKYAEKLVNATKSAAEQGIRICPIICSGAAEVTEYTMREVAIYTGGTFIYVTDDSGIGGSHYDPNLPNATIELLNSLMVRLVKGYHTGVFEEPISWKQDPNLGTNK